MKILSRIVVVAALFVAPACPGPGSQAVVLPLPDTFVQDTTGNDTPGDTLADTGDTATDVPATDVPTTDVPATDVPATDVPATDVPATDVPATDVPVTDVPTTDVPTTDVPTTDVPTTDVPTTDVPTTDVPSTDVPSTDVPGTDDGGDTTSGTTTIPALQQAQEVTACDPNNIVTGGAVTLAGVVATSPVHQVSASLEAVYVADPAFAATWGGLFVTAPLGSLDGISIGSILTLSGTVEEYYCNTQVAADSVQITGSTAAPSPLVITAPSEMLEGMLVTVQSVTVVSNVAGGLYDIGGGLLVENDFGFFLSMTVGQPYTVTGQLKYAFDQWRVVPRTLDDVVFEGTVNQVTIASIQQSPESVNCTTQDNVSITTGVVIEGTISVGQWDLATSLHGYHLTEGNGAFESIALNVSKAQNSNLIAGQQVRVTGDHVEFFCNTQFAVSSIELLGTTAAPAPITLSTAELAANGESWEGALVSVTGLIAGFSPDFVQFGEIETDIIVGGSLLLIDDAIIGKDVYTQPLQSQSLDVIGAVRYGFGAYRINPRTLSDISW